VTSASAIPILESADLPVSPAIARGAPGPRVGIIYPSGWGNLGDEAIMHSAFNAIRERWPNAVLRAFTLHPERTSAMHNVEADFLTGINLPMFLSARDDAPWISRAANAVTRLTKRIPVLGTACRVTTNFAATIVLEAGAIRAAWRWLADADLVLAAGGGQLDALWGGAWGQPYALARWAWLARRARVPFAFLSVGYGSTPTRLSRQLLRYSISRSAYCSLRDAGSLALTRELGIKTDLPVVPDLAFRLKGKRRQTPRRPGYDIAISPMAFLRPGSWPTRDRSAYDGYIALWADLVKERFSKGDRIHLFVTDPTDTIAVEEVLSKLDDRVRRQCAVVDARDPDTLLEFFTGMDAVVSSRLHGVLLSIVGTRPVLALSHERKVRALMDDVGMGRYCMDLSSATPAKVVAALDDLIRGLDSCTRLLDNYVAVAGESVRRQESMLPRLIKSQ
jgi:polysaccharide pyruvyl transferase WcaK-like protein